MGSRRVGHDWATELNWTEINYTLTIKIPVCTCQTVYFFFNQLFSICDIWLWCGQGQNGNKTGTNNITRHPRPQPGCGGGWLCWCRGYWCQADGPHPWCQGSGVDQRLPWDTMPVGAWGTFSRASPFSSSLGFEIVLWTVHYLMWFLPCTCSFIGCLLHHRPPPHLSAAQGALSTRWLPFIE